MSIVGNMSAGCNILNNNGNWVRNELAQLLESVLKISSIMIK